MTYALPIPMAKSAPTLARWLSLHPFRDVPDAPLWLNQHHKQLLYGAAVATALLGSGSIALDAIL